VRQGRFLEIVAAGITRALEGRDGVRVESPGRLPDRDTGRLREFDVLVHERDVVLPIECRDRRRREDVRHVEAFAQACASVGIKPGVLLSSSGFTRGALVKAAALGVQCRRLERIGRLDWVTDELWLRAYDVTVNDWTVVVRGERVDRTNLFLRVHGVELTDELHRAHVRWNLERISQRQPELFATPGPVSGQLRIPPGPPLEVVDRATGAVYSPEEGRVDLTWVNRPQRSVPLHAFAYADVGAGPIADAVAATFDHDGREHSLVVARSPNATPANCGVPSLTTIV